MDENGSVIVEDTQTAEAAPEVEAATSNESAQQATETKQEYEDRIPKGVQKRIDRAVRDKYQAEARATALEQRLQALEAKQQQQPQSKQSTGAPRIEDYEDINEFIAAAARHESRNIIDTTLSEQKRETQEQRSKAESRERADSWAKRVANITAELPDFYEVLEESNAPLPDHVGAEIMESEFGPQIAYYLATHEDEYAAIAQMQPRAAARAIIRLEEKAKSGGLTKTRPTAAPAPIKPLASKTTTQADPANMSDSEFAKWRKAQIAKRK